MTFTSVLYLFYSFGSITTSSESSKNLTIQTGDGSTVSRSSETQREELSLSSFILENLDISKMGSHWILMGVNFVFFLSVNH
ncbi:hypothetical protein HJC23_010703 [Cyclotella cryptica]|uniref:Uncharacterized protein n=1 Tax=Cyclotella cryptica TaxID=29204 RepID=A0ABD3NJE9_9STRA